MIHSGVTKEMRKIAVPSTCHWRFGWQCMLLLALALLLAIPAVAYGVDTRKPKNNPPPEYPELARRTGIHGVARVQITVAPDGSVKEIKELGGNPVLVDALVRAVKKWKYEAADKTSVVEVQFAFGAQ